jgi:hypothetical protein
MAQKYDAVLAPVGGRNVITHQRFAAKTRASAGLFTALPAGGMFHPFCLLGFPSAAKCLSEAVKLLILSFAWLISK